MGHNAPIDKPFPGSHHFVDSGSLLRVRGPTLLDEPPHLRSKSELVGVLWLIGSLPVGNLSGDRLVFHVPERYFSGEHLNRKHPEREDVSGFGCHCGFRLGLIGRINHLRSKPSR